MRTDEVEAVLEEYRGVFHAIPGVIGTGIGLSESGAVIQVFVDRESAAAAVRDRVASTIDVPVEVIDQGEVADAF